MSLVCKSIASVTRLVIVVIRRQRAIQSAADCQQKQLECYIGIALTIQTETRWPSDWLSNLQLNCYISLFLPTFPFCMENTTLRQCKSRLATFRSMATISLGPKISWLILAPFVGCGRSLCVKVQFPYRERRHYCGQ